jgi:hypothetical protein
MTSPHQVKLTPEQTKRLRKARLEKEAAERRIQKLMARVWPPAGPPTLLDRLVVVANPIQAILRLVSWLAAGAATHSLVAHRDSGHLRYG